MIRSVDGVCPDYEKHVDRMVREGRIGTRDIERLAEGAWGDGYIAGAAALTAERDALAALLTALVAAADAINEGFDPFTSMNCVCSEEAQERCASPVAPEDAPCSTCRHRKVKLQADAARAALARIDAASGRRG